MVHHAHLIAREVGAKVILLHADVVEADSDLSALIEDVGFRVILVSRRQGFRAPEAWNDLCTVVRIPDIAMTRTGQIKVAILLVAAERLIQGGDRILSASQASTNPETIDTIFVLDMGTEMELFSASTADPLPSDVTPTVFERILTLAGELGVEGREGRPVGTLFTIGDEAMEFWRAGHQLVINPFHGYPETERNILDPRLEETIKEFSAIDGAFVIRGDGVILAAGRYLAAEAKLDEEIASGTEDTPSDRGRHHRHDPGGRGAFSQSTGTVSIFKEGRLITDIQKPWGRNAQSL